MASRKGHPLSSATRAKISAALKGKHHAGHPLSASARAKISAALRGKPHPHKGHAVSAATRAKISAALKGKKHPHRGHAMSAATRAKISAALRDRAGHHPAARTTTRRTTTRRTTARHAAARHAATVGRRTAAVKRQTGPVIGTPQKPHRTHHHRPALLSSGRGYHRRTVTHLHHRRRSFHKLRIRRMTTNHRVRQRRVL